MLGTLVSVVGLEEQWELNGKIGRVLGWESEKERWEVVMEDGTGKLLKPKNLKQVDGAKSRTALLSTDIVKNKTSAGTAVGGGGILRGGLAGEEPYAFAPGMRVQICGLQKRSEMNGQLACIVEWLDQEDRWSVLMDDGSGKLFKTCNLKKYEPGENTTQPEETEQPPDGSSGQQTHNESSGRQPLNNMETNNTITDEWSSAAESPVATLPISRTEANKTRISYELSSDAGSPAVAGRNAPSEFSHQLSMASTLDSQNGEQPSAPKASPPRDNSPQNTIAAGTRVQVFGREGNLSVLNGKRGITTDWEDAGQRWRLQMDDGSKTLVKPCNLQACDDATVASKFSCLNLDRANSAPVDKIGATSSSTMADRTVNYTLGMSVQICNLKDHQRFNGLVGTVVGVADADGWLKVQLDGGSKKTIPRSKFDSVCGCYRCSWA